MEERFPQLLTVFPKLECLFLLTQDGVQVTKTFSKIDQALGSKKTLPVCSKKTDHLLKVCYHSVVYNCLDLFFAEPHISLASGNLCVTARAGRLKNPVDSPPYSLHRCRHNEN